MSHSSGISSSQEFLDYISGVFTSNNTRSIKVAIANEKLVCADSKAVQGTWDSDYDKSVLPFLDEKSAAYVLYRLDSQNAHGYEWILICYVPDFAHVREKMLYASTRSTLKKEFGDYRIVDEVFGTTVSDVNKDGFTKHVESQNAPPPLSASETEKNEIKSKECGVDIGASTKRSHMGGVHFPLSNEGTNTLKKLVDGSVSYIRFIIDSERETIELDKVENINVSSLTSFIPNDSPRYHFFRYTHDFEGSKQSPIIFLYSCPGYACKIKERMLYSSCKGSILSVAEDDLQIPVEKKLEISDPADVNESFIYEEIHPKAAEAKKAFEKPKAPGKGGRRLLRGANDS